MRSESNQQLNIVIPENFLFAAKQRKKIDPESRFFTLKHTGFRVPPLRGGPGMTTLFESSP
jgi:hypothetical protein